MFSWYQEFWVPDFDSLLIQLHCARVPYKHKTKRRPSLMMMMMMIVLKVYAIPPVIWWTLLYHDKRMAADKALEINNVSSSPMVGPLDLLFWSLRDLFGFSSVLLYVHRNRRFIRDGSPGRPPRLSHKLLSSVIWVQPQWFKTDGGKLWRKHF